MLKKWSRVALLAAATAFVLAAFGACSDGDSGLSVLAQYASSDGDSGPSVLAQYASLDGELTFYDNGTFVLEDASKAAAVARAIGKTITGTYTGDPVTGAGLKLTASDGTKITATVSGNTLTITVNGTSYPFTKKSGGDGSASGGGNAEDDEVPTVATLPANVGTDPFTGGTYNTANYWFIWLCDCFIEIEGKEFKIDTESNSLTVLNPYGDEGEIRAVLKYAYNSTKKEIYLALSKYNLDWFEDDGTERLGEKDQILSWLESSVGHTFSPDSPGDEPWTYDQEDYEEDVEEFNKLFGATATYGYEVADGEITLTLKDDAENYFKRPVTLVPASN